MAKEKPNSEKTKATGFYAIKVEPFVNPITREDREKQMENLNKKEVTDEEIEKMANQAIKGRFPRKKVDALSDSDKERFYKSLYSKMEFK